MKLDLEWSFEPINFPLAHTTAFRLWSHSIFMKILSQLHAPMYLPIKSQKLWHIWHLSRSLKQCSARRIKKNFIIVANFYFLCNPELRSVKSQSHNKRCIDDPSTTIKKLLWLLHLLSYFYFSIINYCIIYEGVTLGLKNKNCNFRLLLL